jgi:hypothetical protein
MAEGHVIKQLQLVLSEPCVAPLSTATHGNSRDIRWKVGAMNKTNSFDCQFDCKRDERFIFVARRKVLFNLDGAIQERYVTQSEKRVCRQRRAFQVL